MRSFVLDRKSDITGISGTGIIAYGVEWLPNGPCDLFWLGTQTTGQYPSIAKLESIHCYNDNAKVIYLEPNHFVADNQTKTTPDPNTLYPDVLTTETATNDA